MWTQRVAERSGPELTIDVSARPAERLRVRKGSLIRLVSRSGEATDYRVTRTSMPDEFGRCTVHTEPA